MTSGEAVPVEAQYRVQHQVCSRSYWSVRHVAPSLAIASRPSLPSEWSRPMTLFQKIGLPCRTAWNGVLE